MIIRENLFYYTIFILGYGIFGAGISINNNLDIFYLTSPIFFFLILIFLKKENDILFQLTINDVKSIKIQEIIYLTLIFILLFLLVYNKILLSISDDEYAYANLGLIHSNFIIDKISNIKFFENIKIKHLFQIISLVIFFSFICFMYLLNKIIKNKNFQIILIILIVFFFRFLIFSNGGNPFPHPPFVGLSSFISTALVGLSDFSLKFAPFFIYLFLSFYYFFKLKKKLNPFLSFIIVISLFTLPGTLYLSTTVEQSLFSMICFSIIAIELCINENPNYKRLILIILFFSFFRILSILALVFIGFHILTNSKTLKEFLKNSFSVVKNSYPLLLIIPFVIFSFTFDSDLTVKRVGINFLNLDFIINILPFTIIDSYHFVPGIILIMFILGLFINFKKNLFLISFVIICIFIYGNILITQSKYLYEIFFPILLSFIVFNLVHDKKILFKNLIIFLIILIGFSNLYILNNFASICLKDVKPFKDDLSYKVEYGCNIMSSKPFNLKDSFNFLKNHKEFSFINLYVPGVYYGILPSIINDMKTNEYKKHKAINTVQNELNMSNNISWISGDSKNINSSSNIKFILIANLKNSQKLTADLLNTGWIKINENIDRNFGTTSIILFKNNQN